nr:hypothetical protein [Tanacetum cinerariifolium]
MRGSCNSLTELEYHLEEVYKATTDQLDWVNPEGQQYPHNLPQPLPLIPNNRGRRVIPFDHFINNDLEYLRGVNRESALDVYSKRRIITVTELKIVEWHNYKHLDWILEHCHPEASERSSTGSGKLLEEAQPHEARHVSTRSEATDGTLNDVRNALDDRLKGLRMQYLSTTIWRRGDKDRAAAMIQAIKKMLKTRRIMRSLENFVGGRFYEGDFRMLQRII